MRALVLSLALLAEPAPNVSPPDAGVVKDDPEGRLRTLAHCAEAGDPQCRADYLTEARRFSLPRCAAPQVDERLAFFAEDEKGTKRVTIGNESFNVTETPVVTGADILEIVSAEDGRRPLCAFKLAPKGADRFAEATDALSRKRNGQGEPARMAVLHADQGINAPRVRGRLGPLGQISGVDCSRLCKVPLQRRKLPAGFPDPARMKQPRR
jgi:preprotein translocase subunit SecD